VSKKQAVSFSLTSEQIARVEKRMAAHGILNRAEYLLLLHEADEFLGLRPKLNEAHQKVLRPEEGGAEALAMAGEPAARDVALAELVSARLMQDLRPYLHRHDQDRDHLYEKGGDPPARRIKQKHAAAPVLVGKPLSA
jgi:hypothetical protein